MSQLKEKMKVVMLPTRSLFKRGFNLALDGKELVEVEIYNFKTMSYQLFGSNDIQKCVPQHLYICSDREIKASDYVLVAGEHVRKCIEVSTTTKYITVSVNNGVFTSVCQKIEATTDKSLGLPLIRETFVRKYVELQGIDEVMVDMTTMYSDVWHAEKGNGFDIVKTDKDNYITISKIKDSWSKEEVIKLLDKGISEAIMYPEHFVTGICFDTALFNKWIENNI